MILNHLESSSGLTSPDILIKFLANLKFYQTSGLKEDENYFEKEKKFTMMVMVVVIDVVYVGFDHAVISMMFD